MKDETVVTLVNSIVAEIVTAREELKVLYPAIDKMFAITKLLREMADELEQHSAEVFTNMDEAPRAAERIEDRIKQLEGLIKEIDDFQQN